MDTHELVKELGGTVCQCGKPKQSRQTFCRACYFKLPKPMQVALYNRIGKGYEQAYANAIKFLKGEK